MGLLSRMVCPVCGHERKFIIGPMFSDWMTEEELKEEMAAGYHGPLLQMILDLEDEEHILHVEAEREPYHCTDCGEVFEANPLRFRLEDPDGKVTDSYRECPECPNCGGTYTNVATVEEYWRCICGAKMKDLGIDQSIILD